MTAFVAIYPHSVNKNLEMDSESKVFGGMRLARRMSVSGISFKYSVDKEAMECFLAEVGATETFEDLGQETFENLKRKKEENEMYIVLLRGICDDLFADEDAIGDLFVQYQLSIRQQYPIIEEDVIRKAYEIKREIERIQTVISTVRIKIYEITKILEREKSLKQKQSHLIYHDNLGRDTRMNDSSRRKVITGVHPSKALKSIEGCHHFEARRNYSRNEFLNDRHNRRSIAYLRRRLILDDSQGPSSVCDISFDCASLDNTVPLVSHCSEKSISQGASKSEHTFDLSSLDKALPPASHCSEKSVRNETL